jgi:hypothetical protein
MSLIVRECRLKRHCLDLDEIKREGFGLRRDFEINDQLE